MRILVLAALVAVAAFALPVNAASTVEVRGTIAAWVPPVAVAEAGDTVVFSSFDIFPHIGVVDGLTPKDGRYSTTTTYENVPAGTYPFVCSIHPWMVGELVVR